MYQTIYVVCEYHGYDGGKKLLSAHYTEQEAKDEVSKYEYYNRHNETFKMGDQGFDYESVKLIRKYNE